MQTLLDVIHKQLVIYMCGNVLLNNKSFWNYLAIFTFVEKVDFNFKAYAYIRRKFDFIMFHVVELRT